MSNDASFFLVFGIVFLAAGIFSGYALYFAYPNVITDMMSDAQPPIAGLFAPLLPVIFFAVGLIMMYYFFRPSKQRGFPRTASAHARRNTKLILLDMLRGIEG